MIKKALFFENKVLTDVRVIYSLFFLCKSINNGKKMYNFIILPRKCEN